MPSRLKLEDLIDLETQLQRDQDEDPRRLRQRDAEIGREINASELSGIGLFLAWLSALQKTDRRDDQQSTGHQVVQFLAAAGLVLALVGALVGGGVVAGWLRLNPAEPVNAILFWLSVIGLQILLLAGWLLAIIPRRWAGKLPAAGALQQLLRWIGCVPPLIATWLATRMSEETRQHVREVRGTVARFDWLYGKIRFWVLIELTQIFALAYNFGAIIVFVLMTHGSDPAFCWRSTVLDKSQVHSATRAVSSPWAGFSANATLTPEDLAATRYSSFDRQFLDDSNETNHAGWRKWSFFLLASLLVYGLVPRCMTLFIARRGTRKAMAAVRLDHAEFQELADRLKRPFVDTTARETDETEAREPGTRSLTAPSDPIIGEGPFPVVKCNGVKLTQDEISELVQSRFGKSISVVHDVLGVDDEADQAMLVQLAAEAPEEVFVLIEAWEPPVQEYLDLLRNLRATLGDRRMIDVVLYNRSPEGANIVARTRDVEMWRSQLATTGDPWLRVETLVEGAAA